MRFVEIDGNKIRYVGSERATTVQRLTIYIVQGNDWPVAEWIEPGGTRHSALVASLTLAIAPVGPDEAPRPTLEDSPAPRLGRKRSKPADG